MCYRFGPIHNWLTIFDRDRDYGRDDRRRRWADLLFSFYDLTRHVLPSPRRYDDRRGGYGERRDYR